VKLSSSQFYGSFIITVHKSSNSMRTLFFAEPLMDNWAFTELRIMSELFKLETSSFRLLLLIFDTGTSSYERSILSTSELPLMF
jgi:hypothetical protein